MGSAKLREDASVAVGDATAAAVAWRAAGVVQVTVVAKATFAFAADAPMSRVEPQPIVRAEVHHGNSPARSVRLTTDLAPYLHQADVVFNGQAHAANGPTEAMTVRLGVFDGPRALLDKSVVARDKAGFQQKALVYEHAYGGFGWPDNPCGVGVTTGSAEPTVVDPKDPKRLAGFGPIGQSWPARRALLGATPRQALAAPIAEIPDGFDWSYFQAAPPDQRTSFLRGDEWIVMEGLHPSLPLARTRLPGARGVARVHGLAAHGVAEGQPLALHADTLRIDGDEQRCTVTFRGVFPVASEAALASLVVLVGVELPGAPIAWPAVAAVAAAAPDGSAAAPRALPAGEALPGTMLLDPSAAGGATLPFVAGASALARGAAPPSPPTAGSFSGTRVQGTDEQREAASRGVTPFEGATARAQPARAAEPFSGTMAVAPDAGSLNATPFEPGVSPLAQATESPRPRDAASSGTMWHGADEQRDATLRPVTPFAGAIPPAAPPPVIAAPPPVIAAPPPVIAAPAAPSDEPSEVVSPRATPAEVHAAESPWAPVPPPSEPAAPAPPPQAEQPAASPVLKKGLYGRFGRVWK